MKRYQIYERSHYDYETKLVGEYNKFEMAKKFVEVVSANEYDVYEEYGKYLTIVDTKKDVSYSYDYNPFAWERVWR